QLRDARPPCLPGRARRNETTMTTSTNDRLEIASDWLLRIQEESLDSEELAQWLQWYDADPANRDAFEKVRATFESIHALPQSERRAWASQLADARKSR